ncbi:Spermidine Putrescine ABC transporter permease component potC (TC_3.A.1.11.1) [plant metagenome]|uniref:Spermidine Putrescine ABC transporter permease component potC (TC_3.A.1.11.1) n=1 Tax=plant metagenome TaxID=1297885 RepID=A0A484QZP7_9ZZZZ
MNTHTLGLVTRVSACLVLGFLALPILIIFPLALSPSEYLTFPPQGFSLRWLEAVLESPDWRDSIWLSFKIALGSTVLAVILSVLAALALVRGRFKLKQIVYALILLPMIVPNIISAIAMFFFFADKGGVFGSTVAIIIGHAVIALPIAIIILSSTLQGVDSRLENAALSLGANRFTAFRRITLPLIAPGIASACIFAFLSSFDELLIAMFMAGSTAQTLPVRIWNSVLFQLDPTIAAVSALLVIVSVLALLAANLFARRGARA